MSGSRRKSSWRELALVGCALLLPIPLLAVGGHIAPLLPPVVERSVAALLPAVTGTNDGASASGSAAARVGPGSGSGPAASLGITGSEVAASLATGTIEAAESSVAGGTGDNAGDAGAPSGGEAAETDEETPPPDEETPPPDENTPTSGPSEPQTQDPSTSSGPGAAPAVQFAGGGEGASVGVSADASGVTASTEPEGGSGDPGGSLAVTSTDASTTGANTSDVPASGLPIP